MKTEVFEYDDVIVQRKGCFRISIVLAFSRGWAKTNRMHDGWTHKKNSVFEIIRIRVDEANIKEGSIRTILHFGRERLRSVVTMAGSIGLNCGRKC